MRKLTCKDLMIGDMVYSNCVDGSKILVRVTSIDSETLMISGKGEFGNHWCNIQYVEPIRLTCEFLANNGFVVSVDDDGHERFTLAEGPTSFSVKYARSVFQWINPIDFMYVHELQHALSFCDIEKEFEL